jgi:hypothetical protein
MIREKRKRAILSTKRLRQKDSLDEINYKSIAAAGLLGISSLISPADASEKPTAGKSEQVKYPYTVEDIIAATLVDEAGGEKDAERGMTAVLNVLMKRGKGDFRRAGGECLKPKQFSGWNPVNKSDINSINKFIDSKRKHTKFSLALKLAAQARAGTLKDITNGADHFLNVNLTKVQSKTSSLPSWFDKKKITTTIGNHTYLRLT